MHTLNVMLATILSVSAVIEANAQDGRKDTTALENVISRYHNGFVNENPKVVLSSLGSNLIMFNGNFSCEPTQWQAHLYLSGEVLHQWPEAFLKSAGPYKNKYEFIHIDIRGNAALVVTKETGGNRFRNWENEKATYLLGRQTGEWKIIGLFIRDIRNPE